MKQRIMGQKFITCPVGDIVGLPVPAGKILAECCSLQNSVNSTTVTQIVDVLRKLGTQRVEFLLLLSHAARYMCLAGKTLKKLYPCLMHVTCIAHLIH